MSRLPSTGPSLQRYLRQQARTAQRQQQSSAFNLSGTSVVAEDVTEVDGSLNVVGSLNVSGPAVITGTLSLPAGIIDNAALASPVVPQAVYFSDSHTLIAASAIVSTATFTVPAGFTSAIVSVAVQANGVNQNTTGGDDGLGGDTLYLDITVGAVVGAASFRVPGNFIRGGGVALAATVLTGLSPGGTFDIPVEARTGYFTWTLGISTVVSGSILWLR